MNYSEKILFLISTPIGNLGDITLRALETLRQSDLILCEDTRITCKLLNHYEIEKQTKSYNAYLERSEKVEKWLEILFETNDKLALVTDNGTPCISDPGFKIVNFCRQNKILVEPIPGANAAITCLSASGFYIKNFLFYGFLPNKKKKRENILKDLLEKEKKTLVFYESPYRVEHFFQALVEINENLEIFYGREMTKKFQEYYRETANSALVKIKKNKIKGEFTIIINNNV